MELHSSILRTIAYFDLFNYPLTIEDIHRFLDTETDTSTLEKELGSMIHQGFIYRTDVYYSVKNDPALARKRQRGEILADDLLRIAARNARLLYQFPYVVGVCISGSLSKRCADDRSDIDYFIITKANRLWIARTLMHLLKKFSYLRGHQHRFCMNYYVDEQALEIGEKNIFTATELLTLMPMCGNGGLDRFFEANDWTSLYLPHYRHRHWTGRGYHRTSLLKRLLERLFDNRLGDVLEKQLYKITDLRWKKKTERGDLNIKGDIMALQCSPHYSRPDPERFQRKILAKYHRRLKELVADETIQYSNLR
ncbi:MAG TPA: hypothetical protein VG605_02285 [Puia sp.]|jgi:hypothetical protein|nr:hypothetical protein [Puia sp.]